MSKKSDYEITTTAGDWVAGKRSTGAGSVVSLTQEQAQYDVMSGALKVAKRQDKAEATPSKPRTRSKTSEGNS